MLSYSLLLLPAVLFFTIHVPYSDLPGEVVALLILPGILYFLLHSIRNRQGFNFIIANFLIAIPPTLALFILGFRQDWFKHSLLFTAMSCLTVLIVWWKYPAGARRIF
ncbi:MAG: hypothetical protein EBU52_21760 [Cytophagia bacterium]|nr:hypothetical protein [Cytophagia bacterium]